MEINHKARAIDENYKLYKNSSVLIPHYQLPASIPKLRSNKPTFTRNGKDTSRMMNLDLVDGDAVVPALAKTAILPW